MIRAGGRPGAQTGPWTRGALPGKANSAHADAGSPAAPTAPGPATKRAAAATRALRQTANTPEAWPSGREKRRARSVTSWRRSPAPSSTARPQRLRAQPLGQPPPQPPSSAGHRPAGPAPPRPHHGAWPSQSWRPRRTAPAAARASIWGAPGHVPAVLARRGTAAHRPWLPGRPRPCWGGPVAGIRPWPPPAAPDPCQQPQPIRSCGSCGEVARYELAHAAASGLRPRGAPGQPSPCCPAPACTTLHPAARSSWPAGLAASRYYCRLPGAPIQPQASPVPTAPALAQPSLGEVVHGALRAWPKPAGRTLAGPGSACRPPRRASR